MNDIDAIAVTQGPGLIGALLIGINAAKALAFAYDKLSTYSCAPYCRSHLCQSFRRTINISINYANCVRGHTELVYMKSHMHFEVIGETRDDAVGEAYDKVARTIDLPYPGGPQIDKLAQYGKDTYDFPRVWLEKKVMILVLVD